MISVDQNQLDKLAYVDKLFDAMTIEKLKEITEPEQIVSILAGTNGKVGLVQQLVRENQNMSMEIMNLQSQMYALKSDFQILVKLVTKPFEYSSASDSQNLKSRHNVY
jgi:hypothetical protein